MAPGRSLFSGTGRAKIPRHGIFGLIHFACGQEDTRPQNQRIVVMRRHSSAPSTTVSRLLSLWVVLALVFSLCPGGAVAFVPKYAKPSAAIRASAMPQFSLSRAPRKSSTSINALWDDVAKFFDELGNNNNSNDRGNSGDSSTSSGEEQQYLGNTRILTIPVKSFKVGGLRLYMSLFFMGMSNTPDKGSWQSWQSGDAGIDVYFHDQTGALLIELCEETNRILVDRMGTSPSNAYMMQESVIIDGLLDELDTIANDEEIPLEDRLLVLKDPGDAIDAARESLAFS